MARQDKDGAVPGDRKHVWTEKDGDAQGNEDGTFCWDLCDAQAMRHLVSVAGDNGDAVSFATNRQKTGGSITILCGPYKPRWYCGDSVTANELLTRLTARYER
jgi:hypothetical protein